MAEFIWYEYKIKDGLTISIQSENIYEALEYIVRIHKVHPTLIEYIKEENNNEYKKELKTWI